MLLLSLGAAKSQIKRPVDSVSGWGSSLLLRRCLLSVSSHVRGSKGVSSHLFICRLSFKIGSNHAALDSLEHYIDEASLRLRDLPACDFRMLRLKVCVNTPIFPPSVMVGTQLPSTPQRFYLLIDGDLVST